MLVPKVFQSSKNAAAWTYCSAQRLQGRCAPRPCPLRRLVHWYGTAGITNGRAFVRASQTHSSSDSYVLAAWQGGTAFATSEQGKARANSWQAGCNIS